MDELITVAEAESIIASTAFRIGEESVNFADACCRVLREPVLADRPFPPFDRVMMDGIAVNSAHLLDVNAKEFHIEGFAAAGTPRMRLQEAQGCIEIGTGAMLPEGCDAVIPYEHLDISNNYASLKDGSSVKARQNVHDEGSDYPTEALVVDSGVMLSARELAVIASCGLTKISVSRKPQIHIVSIGDELRDIGETVEPFQIRRSNAYALEALMNRHYGSEVVLHHFPDDPDALAQGIPAILEMADMVVFSGAVSQGKKDYLADVLIKLGVEKQFHGVNQKPGKPMWYGVAKDGTQVFALPGNPVSSMVCAVRYVLPALTRMVGLEPSEPVWVAMTETYHFPPFKTLFLPVVFDSRRDATLTARPMPISSSGDLVSITYTDGFIELPEDLEEFPTGYTARYFPWGYCIGC